MSTQLQPAADQLLSDSISLNDQPPNNPTSLHLSTHTLSQSAFSSLAESAIGGPAAFWRAWKDASELTTENDDPDWIFHSIVEGDHSEGGRIVANTINRVLHASLAFALGCHPNFTEGGDVNKVIASVYKQIDRALISASMNFLNPNPSVKANSVLPPGTAELLSAAGLLHPLDGAVGATVILDLVRRQLYVATLGDCRVVLGWKDDRGKWGAKESRTVGGLDGHAEVYPYKPCFGRGHMKPRQARHNDALEILVQHLPESTQELIQPCSSNIIDGPSVQCTALEKHGARLELVALMPGSVTISSKDIIKLLAHHFEDQHETNDIDIQNKEDQTMDPTNRLHDFDNASALSDVTSTITAKDIDVEMTGVRLLDYQDEGLVYSISVIRLIR